MLEALEPFGLGDFTSLLTEIKLQNWGKNLVIEGLYDPQEQNTPFTITLHQCYEIRWIPHKNDSNLTGNGANNLSQNLVTGLEPADLIDCQLQHQDDRSVAIFYTDLFELIVVYDRFTCKVTSSTPAPFLTATQVPV